MKSMEVAAASAVSVLGIQIGARNCGTVESKIARCPIWFILSVHHVARLVLKCASRRFLAAASTVRVLGITSALE